MSDLIDRLAREADEEFNPYDQTYVSMAREDVRDMIASALRAFQAEAAKVARDHFAGYRDGTWPYGDRCPGVDRSLCAGEELATAIAAKIEAL